MIDSIIPFKGREVDFDEPVQVYRCLNRKGRFYSIRQNGLVVGHTSGYPTPFVLKDCSLVVNKGGKERCLKEKRRNVHAYIQGMPFGTTVENTTKQHHSLYYNPYEERGFYTAFEENIEQAKFAFIQLGFITIVP